MGDTASIAEDLRTRIIAEPSVILEDIEVMRALVTANERMMGANVVDLRGIAMERLEERLDRLEDTHRSVIAAAYENLAGTNMIHRAVLALLEPQDFAGFLGVLQGEVADALRVDALRLLLETVGEDAAAPPRALKGPVSAVPAGFIHRYLGGGPDGPARPVTLRQCDGRPGAVYGGPGPDLKSEACLRLDLGEGRMPGLLVLGAEDPHQFTPAHGTDLLGFFGGVFERSMQRWLA